MISNANDKGQNQVKPYLVQTLRPQTSQTTKLKVGKTCKNCKIWATKCTSSSCEGKLYVHALNVKTMSMYIPCLWGKGAYIFYRRQNFTKAQNFP